MWGAAPNETRIFVDGVPVPALYHVGGYRSAVGNDLIGDIHLTPAAFGVDRGRAIGGVIDIGLADPTKAPAWRVQADVLDGSVEGKTKVGDLTIAGAVRQSWLDRAIGVIEDPHTLAPNAPLPRWTDAQIVARAPLADGSRAVGVGARFARHARSHARVDRSGDPDLRSVPISAWRAPGRAPPRSRRWLRPASVWAGRDHASDDLAVGTITAIASERRVGRRCARRADRTGCSTGSGSRSAPTSMAKPPTLHRRRLAHDPGARRRPPHLRSAARRRCRRRCLARVDDRRRGLRIARCDARPRHRELRRARDAWLLTASRLTPRIGSIVNVASQQTCSRKIHAARSASASPTISIVRADGGLYHQARAASDTSAVFGTPDLGLEQAWHAIAGGQWRHAPFALEAAGYARWLDDLVARDLAVTPMLAHALTQDGIGNVYGLQLTARVIGWHGLSGWLSYNLSRSRRKDADDQPWRYFDHDQTHGLIAVAGWEHGAWTLGGRIRYATGEPRTAVIGAFFDSREWALRTDPRRPQRRALARVLRRRRSRRAPPATRRDSRRRVSRDPEPHEPRERRGADLQRRLHRSRVT